MEWIKSHPAMTGGIVIVGVIVIMFAMGGHGGGTVSAGAPVQDQSAVASGNALQAAQLQMAAHSQDVQASLAISQQHEANQLDIAKLEAGLAGTQIAASAHNVEIQADVAKSIATLQQGVSIAQITADTQKTVAASNATTAQITAWSDVTKSQNAMMADLQKTNAQLTAQVAQSGQQAQVQIAQANNSRGFCFITTAAVDTLGMTDDCRELQILRAYRDRVLPNIAGGKEALAEYRELGPAVVEKIAAWSESERRAIYIVSWREYILPAVQCIERGQHTAAFAIYRDMVRGLSLLEIRKAA